MSDSDDILTKSDGPDDLGSMVVHLFGLVPWKLTIFIFICFIVLNTSVFIDHVLTSWPGAVDGRHPSERGLLIQGLILTIGVVLMSICVNGELI